ncbi:hypothetical protein WJX84_003304 [Apatococcus fuscideae]|uniref:Mediator of RNA polymerase II transcription subunit 4 n=1 Tax=Apatococcus fuscideae TaxID=2026836 RepID=A0AAW1T1W9_9CHLO
MEPPSKKQRLGEFLQNSHEQQGLSEGDGSISEAVRALLQQVQPGSAAAAAGLATLLRDMAGRLADTADALHASLQSNTLPEVPSYCSMPASTEFAKDVISYGRRLSFTTFAPLGWTQGLPLGHFRPPAPQDHQLHASTLSRFAVEEDAKRAAAAAAAAKQPPPAVMILPASEAKPAAGSALPRAAPAPIQATGFPPGRQPGDALPDMDQMPAMPEGWKPGDPIPMLSAFLPQPPARSSEDGMQEAEAALLRQQPQQLPAPSKEQSDSDNASSELSAGAGAQAPRALDKIFDMGFMSEGSDLESEDDEEEEGADPAGSGNSHERA